MDSPRVHRSLSLLTSRQRQCLDLAAELWTSKDIARQLEIAPKTVDRHIEEAVRKLGVADRAAAVRALRAEQDQRSIVGYVEPEPVAPQGIDVAGEEPHGERAPMLEPVLVGQSSLRGGEGSNGETPSDVHLDRRSGRLEHPRIHPAAEESGVVAGTAEAGLSGYVAWGASGGDHQFGGHSGRWTNPNGGWAPEPARRLVWVLVIAAGLALLVGALAGSFDLMSALHRFKASELYPPPRALVTPHRADVFRTPA